MKRIEIESTIDKEGKLAIPAHLLDELGLVLGDTVKLAYISKSSDHFINTSSEFLITSKGIAALKEYEESEISLPYELLEAASIPFDSDIEIVCTEGAIIIMAVDLLDMIPDELCHLFAELGISPDTVRSVIKSGGVWDEQ